MDNNKEAEVWVRLDKYSSDYIEYFVSDMGRVKSVRNGKEHILKPQTQSAGYLCVFLSYNGAKKCVLVHRLVGETFIDKPEDKPIVHHINQDRQDPQKENLQWATYKENMNEAARKKIANKKRTAIVGVNSKNEWVDFESLADCCERLGVFNRQRITQILDNNSLIFAPGVEIPISVSEIKEEDFAPEMAIRDRMGETWRLYRVEQIFNEKGNVTYQSPNYRKKMNAKRYEPKAPVVDKNGMIRAELPRDAKGNIIKVKEPLPAPYPPGFLENLEKNRKDK